MQNASRQILLRIQRAKPGSVFVPMDFLDLASRAAVDQVLSRLVRAGTLHRIGRGLYHLPQFNKALGLAIPPDADTIAQAIGRQTNSRVVPTDASAANQLGLSTQVPAQLVYLTDGRSRKIHVGQRTFHFRHVSPKRLPPGDSPVDLAMQATRYAADNHLNDRLLALLAKMLSPSQQAALLRKAKYTGTKNAKLARQLAHPSQERPHG